MSTGKVPVTLSYRKRGLAPPVFVAGSFSDPHWDLQEMHCVTDESGEKHFTIQVPVEPGKEYHYKFKVGDQDGWILDDLATVVKDGSGKHCNLLKVPMTSNTDDGARTPLVEATERGSDGADAPSQQSITASSPKSLLPNVFKGKRLDTEQRSRTPIKQVADTAAEVADTAAKLDVPESPVPRLTILDEPGNAETVEEEIKTPLFAHESLGAHSFVDDGVDHDHFSLTSPTCLLSDSTWSLEDLDVDDPTLEKFPCDKLSVLDTLRKIQSSTDDGQHSSPATSRKGSADSSEGNTGHFNPAFLKTRDTRTSRSSFGRPVSSASLGCIDEEPRISGDVSPGTRYNPQDVRGRYNEAADEEEDDGLMMKSVRV